MATLKEHLAAKTLPAHVQARHFDENAEVPDWMEASSNWMNVGTDTAVAYQDGHVGPVYVRLNGAIRPCTNRIHLDAWLAQGGVIVPKPA